MESVYDVLLAGKKVGNAKVEKTGLYYQIECLCQLDSNQLYRVMTFCGDKQVDLGICVPGKNGIGLSVRIPVKRLGEGDMTFTVTENREKHNIQFYPLSEELPFEELYRIKNARLMVMGGQTGVIFKKPAPDRPDSDQNPEHEHK